VPAHDTRAPRPLCWKNFSARVFVVLLGLGAVSWGALVLPPALSVQQTTATADELLLGEQFSSAALKSAVPTIESIERSGHCEAAAKRNASIIRLGMVESAVREGAAESLPGLLNIADADVRAALACSPTDSYLWLVLFWLDSNRNGFRDAYFQYLDMSYQYGPYEGWIAVRRSHLAFATFEWLPSHLKVLAEREFLSLLKSRLYQQASDILTGPGWHVRGDIMPLFSNLSLAQLGQFCATIRETGGAQDDKTDAIRRSLKCVQTPSRNQ
jgi:hypothetical protein